jgi:hypothetical protein
MAMCRGCQFGVVAPVPLTTRGVASYDQFYPCPCVAEWSNLDVSRSVRIDRCRHLVRLMAAVFSLSWGARECSAAGCHTLDRPILQSRLSWDHDLAWDAGARPVTLAPPVLVHPPCQGETPHGLAATSIAVAPALLERAGVDPPHRGGLLGEHAPCPHCQPPALRIDRPPRPLESRVTMKPAA